MSTLLNYNRSTIAIQPRSFDPIPSPDGAPALRLPEPLADGALDSDPYAVDPRRVVFVDAEVARHADGQSSRWLVGLATLDPDTGRLATTIVEDADDLYWWLASFHNAGYVIVGFNSSAYDLPLLCGIFERQEVFELSQDLIRDRRPRRILPPWCEGEPNHIDLGPRVGVVKRQKQGADSDDQGEFRLAIGLKRAAANLGVRSVAALPFDPNAPATDAQWAETRNYNIHDLHATAALFEATSDTIAALGSLSREFGIDMRSMRESQVVESILTKEYESVHGAPPPLPQKRRYQKPTTVRYRPPRGVPRPQNPDASSWFDRIVQEPIEVCEYNRDRNQKPKPDVPTCQFTIGDLQLTSRGGGLHSVDGCILHDARDGAILAFDVSSFYPAL